MRCKNVPRGFICLGCYRAVKGRGVACGGRKRRPDIAEWSPHEDETMAMKRPEVTDDCLSTQSGMDESFRAFYPNVHDHLVEDLWSDGKVRKSSTLMIVVENGRWKGWIHDRDGRRSSWLSAASWEGILEVVEKSLAEGTTEWRADKR